MDQSNMPEETNSFITNYQLGLSSLDYPEIKDQIDTETLDNVQLKDVIYGFIR